MPTMEEIRRFSSCWEKFCSLPGASQDSIFKKFWPEMEACWPKSARPRDRHRQFFRLIYNPVLTEDLIAAVDLAHTEAGPWNTGYKQRARKFK